MRAPAKTTSLHARSRTAVPVLLLGAGRACIFGVEDFFQEDEEYGEKRPRRRVPRDRVLEPEESLERLAWLREPVVWWAGSGGPRKEPTEPVICTAADIVAEHLRGKTAGIYRVKLRPPAGHAADPRKPLDAAGKTNPELERLEEVTVRHLASAAFQLRRARERADRFAPLVGDVMRWSRDLERVLQRIGAAWRARDLDARLAPESLAVEEGCIWLGLDALRPSQRLEEGAVRHWLADRAGQGALGAMAAAVLLGQRHRAGPIHAAWKAAMARGRRWSRWPLDLVCLTIQQEAVGGPQCGLSGPKIEWANRPETAVAVLEYWLLQRSLPPVEFWRRLPTLIETCDRLDRERERRLQWFQRLFDRAAADSPAFLGAGKERPVTSGRAYRSTFMGCWEELRRSTPAPLGKVDPADLSGILRELRFWLDGELSSRRQAIAAAGDEAAQRSYAQCSLEQQRSILRGIGERLKETADAQSMAAARARGFSLAARLAALVRDPAEAVDRLSAWLEACREHWPPGEDGAGAYRQGLLLLGCWMAIARWDSKHVEGMLEAVSDAGPLLLRRLTPDRCAFADAVRGQWPQLASAGWVIGRLGGLPRGIAQEWISARLLTIAAQIAERHSSGLAEYAGFFAGAGPDWDAVRTRGVWAWVFSLKRSSLAGRLLEWVRRVAVTRGWPVAAGVDFLQALSVFAEGDTNALDREEWLERRMHWLEAVADRAKRFLDRLPPQPAREWNSPSRAFSRRADLVLEVGWQWRRCHYAGEDALVECLLAWSDREDDRLRQRTDCDAPWFYSLTSSRVGLYADLCCGDLDWLARILEQPPPSCEWQGPEDPRLAWQYIGRFPELRMFARSLMNERGMFARVVMWLSRVSLALRVRLHGLLDRQLAQWHEPRPVHPHRLPRLASEPARAQLAHLAAYRALAGEAEPWPQVVQRELNLGGRWAAERDYLAAQRKRGDLDGRADVRRRHLDQYLANPARVACRVAQRLERILPEQIRRARWRALECLVDRALASHWEGILGRPAIPLNPPDWDNALRLYTVVRYNRSALKRMLRRLAAGDALWIRSHPANQAFLRQVSKCGLDPGPWLEPASKEFRVPGETWIVSLETDPLRVLQMGNLFGTCLSVGDANDFATVANAVELNKRVLYMRNGAGAIVGRKLIGFALTRRAQQPALLLGFRSYGAGDEFGWPRPRWSSPWVKIGFDIFCRELAGRLGIELASDSEEDRKLAERLPLFCRWYNDGPEPFDGWIRDSTLWESGQEDAGCQALADSIRGKLAEPPGPAPAAREVVRALLWLGNRALDVLQDAGIRALSDEQRTLLGRHTGSPAVRQWLEETGSSPQLHLSNI